MIDRLARESKSENTDQFDKTKELLQEVATLTPQTRGVDGLSFALYPSKTLRQELIGGRISYWHTSYLKDLFRHNLPDREAPVLASLELTSAGRVLTLEQRRHVDLSTYTHTGIEMILDPETAKLKNVVISQGGLRAYLPRPSDNRIVDDINGSIKQEAIEVTLGLMAKDLKKGRERWIGSLRKKKEGFMQGVRDIDPEAPGRVSEVLDYMNKALPENQFSAAGLLTAEAGEIPNGVRLLTTLLLNGETAEKIIQQNHRYSGFYQTAEYRFNEGRHGTIIINCFPDGKSNPRGFHITIERGRFRLPQSTHVIGGPYNLTRSLSEWDFASFLNDDSSHSFGLQYNYTNINSSALLFGNPNSTPVGPLFE